MQVHHHKDLCVTDQEIGMFKNWNSSQMSNQIQHLQTEDNPILCMNFWAVQDKQRKQVLQLLQLRLTNQEFIAFMCRKISNKLQRIKNFLM